MALIDESRAAFRELREVMPSTIEFNGITKTGVSQTLTIKRAQELQNYQIDGSTQFTLEDTDFAALEAEGLKDRVGEVRINGSDPLVITSIDRHPNSAVVHLFLVPSQ
ncbi:MAG TPA: hypothetical protein VF089_17900 [Candidatus Binatia bacterium]